MLNKIKSFFKKKEPIVSTITTNELVYNHDWIASNFLNLVLVNETPEQLPNLNTQKELERREKLWKEAEETLFQMKKVRRASEKVYEKMLITEKMYKDSLHGNK
jgi:hypothetical protein